MSPRALFSCDGAQRGAAAFERRRGRVDTRGAVDLSLLTTEITMPSEESLNSPDIERLADESGLGKYSLESSAKRPRKGKEGGPAITCEAAFENSELAWTISKVFGGLVVHCLVALGVADPRRPFYPQISPLLASSGKHHRGRPKKEPIEPIVPQWHTGLLALPFPLPLTHA